VDSVELADARWFTRAQARQMLERRHPDGLHVPGRQAIANALVEGFVEGA
jgi:NAD+ diphosphatase